MLDQAVEAVVEIGVGGAIVHSSRGVAAEHLLLGEAAELVVVRLDRAAVIARSSLSLRQRCVPTLKRYLIVTSVRVARRPAFAVDGIEEVAVAVVKALTRAGGGDRADLAVECVVGVRRRVAGGVDEFDEIAGGVVDATGDVAAAVFGAD